MAAIVAERYGLHVRKITRKIVRDEDYGAKIFEMVNRTYCGLFDFTVLPPDVMRTYIDTYLGLLDLDFVTAVEDKEGNLVAFSVCMPSIARAVKKGNGYLFPLGWWHLLRAQRHYDTVDMMLVGVNPKWHDKGLSAILHDRLGHSWQQQGVKWCISNPQYEDNSALKIWESYRQKEFYIRRRVYTKTI